MAAVAAVQRLAADGSARSGAASCAAAALSPPAAAPAALGCGQPRNGGQTGASSGRCSEAASAPLPCAPPAALAMPPLPLLPPAPKPPPPLLLAPPTPPLPPPLPLAPLLLPPGAAAACTAWRSRVASPPSSASMCTTALPPATSTPWRAPHARLNSGPAQPPPGGGASCSSAPLSVHAPTAPSTPAEKSRRGAGANASAVTMPRCASCARNSAPVLMSHACTVGCPVRMRSPAG